MCSFSVVSLWMLEVLKWSLLPCKNLKIYLANLHTVHVGCSYTLLNHHLSVKFIWISCSFKRRLWFEYISYKERSNNVWLERPDVGILGSHMVEVPKRNIYLGWVTTTLSLLARPSSSIACASVWRVDGHWSSNILSKILMDLIHGIISTAIVSLPVIQVRHL